MWVGLQNYHVLEPTGLKVLVCVDPSPAGKATVEFGSRLGQATAGPITFLSVVHNAKEIAETRTRLEALREQWPALTPHLDIRVRQGDSTTEILREAQEGLYEIVVIGQPRAAAEVLGTTARQVLSRVELPVLLVQTPRQNIDRILICTAGGEPGKTDVRFGGRLARRTGADVTVLHVHRPVLMPGELQRAERHLLQAQATLRAMGIKSDIKIEEGAEVQTILREAKAGGYDLIVIGAPAPQARQQLYWRDFAAQVVGGATCPVLIVPMLE